MNSKFGFFVATFILLVLVIECAVSERRRKKRYITFPKGATLSVQICLTYQMGITPGSIFTEAINWGINYPLELKKDMMDMTDMSQTSEERILRREKRSLFGKIEKMLYHMGYDGRDCILRAFCEFSSIFKSSDKSIENELLKVFFEYTSEMITEYESEKDRTYHQAQILGEEMDLHFCYKTYPKCHFSLINVITGNNGEEDLLK